MARPELSLNRKGVREEEQSWNPLVNWKREREKRLQEAREEAAKAVTDKLSENERAFIRKLEAINFRGSKLPQSEKAKKTDPEQRYCDLEYAAKGVAKYLQDNPRVISMDIRGFDEKLMTLILLFKQAVEHGDVRGAYAAKGGIIRAVMEIRSRVPQNQPELATQFVEAHSEYLDQWITLTCMAIEADRRKENVQELQKRKKANDEELKKDQDAFDQVLRENPVKLVAFQKLMNYKLGDSRTDWTDVERGMYKDMVEQRLKKMRYELLNMMLLQEEQDLMVSKNNVDILDAKLTALEIVCDPNLLTKFKESVQGIVKNLAESDQRMDEITTFMEKVHGELQQLDQGAGAKHLREIAAEEAAQSYKEFLKRQTKITNENELAARKLRQEMGILTEEEAARIRAENEAAAQRALEESLAANQEYVPQEEEQTEENVQTEEQGELIPN